jgi:hypothetical protein
MSSDTKCGHVVKNYPLTISCKNIHSFSISPAAPPHETAKNVMVSSSRKEGGSDHKKDNEKTRS